MSDEPGPARCGRVRFAALPRITHHFLPCYHPRPSFFASRRIPMEVNLIRRLLDDLAERSEALRRFL